MELDRIFVELKSEDRLRTYAEMTPFVLPWKRIIEKTLDYLENVTGKANYEWMLREVESLQRFIPPELENSTRIAKNLEGLAQIAVLNSLQFNIESIHNKTAELRVAFEDELKRSYFLCLSNVEGRYYRMEDRFDSIVAAKFERITGDIEEAYHCIATGNYTACVFHCMRMLEFGVQRLADHFKIPWQVECNDGKTGLPSGEKRDQEWNALCQQISKKIKNLPATSEAEQELKLAFEDAGEHLSNVRMERNRVMHARYATTKRYRKMSKAVNVLEETRDFMEGLARLLP